MVRIPWSAWVNKALKASPYSTQTELARAVGVAPSVLGGWRNKGSKPDPANARRLSEALHLPAVAVMERAHYYSAREVLDSVGWFVNEGDLPLTAVQETLRKILNDAGMSFNETPNTSTATDERESPETTARRLPLPVLMAELIARTRAMEAQLMGRGTRDGNVPGVSVNGLSPLQNHLHG